MLKTNHICGVFVCLMISLLAGCGNDQADVPEAVETEGDAMVLGYLNTKDYRITITLGSDEPLYTISAQNGNVLARDLVLLELSVRFPELQQVVETGMADLDARLAPSQLEIQR